METKNTNLTEQAGFKKPVFVSGIFSVNPLLFTISDELTNLTTRAVQSKNHSYTAVAKRLFLK